MIPQKNVALEPEVFARVAAGAQKEGRTPDELANEAATRFLTSRRLQTSSSMGGSAPRTWASPKTTCPV